MDSGGAVADQVAVELPARLRVREEILFCQRCELGKKTTPVPFSGPTPAHVAVVGEAPGEQETKRGEPFIGPAGRLLRRLLEEVGFNPDKLFFCNSASCNPGRTPSREEINACSGNLAAQLELADPTWVLLVGGVALSTFRPDLKVSLASDHLFFSPDRKPNYFVTYHPSWALRNGMSGEETLRKQLQRFFNIVAAPELDAQGLTGWVRYVNDACLKCGTAAEDMPSHGDYLWLDSDGGSWCRLCYLGRAVR